MNYGFAEFVNTIAIVFGAILMTFGAIAFFIMLPENWIAALANGGISVATGVVIIAIAQLSNATIHTARESRKTNEFLVTLVKNQAAETTAPNKVVRSGQHTDAVDNNYSAAIVRPGIDKVVYVKTYKGYRIEKIEGTRIFLVDGKDFEGIIAAEQYIISQLD